MSLIRRWLIVFILLVLTIVLTLFVVLNVNYLHDSGRISMSEFNTTVESTQLIDFGLFDNSVIEGTEVQAAIDTLSDDYIVMVSNNDLMYWIVSGKEYTVRFTHYGCKPVACNNNIVGGMLNDTVNVLSDYLHLSLTNAFGDYFWYPGKPYVELEKSKYTSADNCYEYWKTDSDRVSDTRTVHIDTYHSTKSLEFKAVDEVYRSLLIYDKNNDIVGVWFLNETKYQEILNFWEG